MFNVTYEIVTEESSAEGESDQCGFIAKSVKLREALRLVSETESTHCSQVAIEPSSWPGNNFNWVTVYNSADWLENKTENRSLHIPTSVTPASRDRILRLIQSGNYTY